MQAESLHEDSYLRIHWDRKTRIIGIDWKEATGTMTDEDFKVTLMLFAVFVEREKATGIVVDVAKFRHKMGPEVQQWRVKNISTRYAAAGVKRFAFLLPDNAAIPPMMNQSSAGESFATRAFNNREQATSWLCGGA